MEQQRAELYEAVRALRGQQMDYDKRWVAIDELALDLAQHLRLKFARYFKISLSYDEWTRMCALFQVELRTVIEHTVLDPPPFPGTER